MTTDDLLARFPEIPSGLAGEPVLAELAAKCGALLSRAVKPAPCSTAYDEGNHYYMKLVAPLAIHGLGLSTREKVVAQMRELIGRHDADPAGFAASLLPPDVAPAEVRGPGCA